MTAKKVTKPETSLVLRVCRKDMTSHDGFKWPKKVGSIVSAPDWIDNKECGNGLHGWLYGQGDHSCVNYWGEEGANWVVLEVETAGIIMLGGKCKFQSAKIKFIGAKQDAAEYLIKNEPKAASVAVIGRTVEVSEGGEALAGALSTMTGGDSAKMTGGDSAKMTGGDSAKMTGGDSATMTGGDSAKMTGGDKSVLCFSYYDKKSDRQKMKLAYVGEDGIKPNVPYRLNDKHELEEVKA